MRVFQSTYKDRNGRTRKTKTWYVEFTDHRETRRRASGLSDKRQTEALGRNIEKLVNVKVSGDMPDQSLTRWIEAMPPKLRAYLGRIGLLDAGRVAALHTLAEHLEGTPDAPGWRQYLTAKGNTAKHVDLFCGRVRRAFAGCKAVYWSDLSATKLMSWLDHQRADTVDEQGRTVKRGLGAYAFNGYVTALNGFGRWMVREGRVSENLMVGLRKLNPRTDQRHQRRALTVDELRWLLETTRRGPERKGMSGIERALLYRVAVETGLRASELRSLTRASFKLDGEHPTVTVEAAYSKHRREDVLPLRADTAADLRDFLAVKMAGAAAFAMPRDKHMAMVMWKADLASARQAWLADAVTAQEREKREASSFLSYQDAAGYYADFHALRHTTGSLLAASGAHPKVAQSVMRHSSIELTMSRYSHVFAGQEADAVAALPNLDAPPVRQSAKATGTDNAKALQDAPGRPRAGKCRKGRPSTRQNAGRASGGAGASCAAQAMADAGKEADSVLAVRLAHQSRQRQTAADKHGQNHVQADNERTRTNIGESQHSCGFSAQPAEGFEPATSALQSWTLRVPSPRKIKEIRQSQRPRCRNR